LADFGLHPPDHILGRELGAVENYGVGSRPHGGDVATGVSGVPFVLGPQHFVRRDFDAARQEFLVPAPRPFARIGDEEKLTLGLGKNNRPLIPALADEVTAN
jgi:hypothetical protein